MCFWDPPVSPFCCQYTPFRTCIGARFCLFYNKCLVFHHLEEKLCFTEIYMELQNFFSLKIFPPKFLVLKFLVLNVATISNLLEIGLTVCEIVMTMQRYGKNIDKFIIALLP